MTEILTMQNNGLEIAQLIGSLTALDVTRVYSGRPTPSGNHCRCGCCGNYRVHPAHARKDDAKEDISLTQVKRILGILQAETLNGNPTVTVDPGCYADVEMASGRCYTIYFD